jgi:hypothetical protein
MIRSASRQSAMHMQHGHCIARLRSCAEVLTLLVMLMRRTSCWLSSSAIAGSSDLCLKNSSSRQRLNEPAVLPCKDPKLMLF